MTTASVGYLSLLRGNRDFRRLWYGQLVSQFGDWFDTIALFTLLLNLTSSGQAVGLLLVAEFLPAAIISPFAGVVVDRLPRRLVMVASDIGRALLVLLLLFVDNPGQVWLVYLVVVLKMGLAACFEPARQALIPNLCRPGELIAANAISSATWSVILAFGAALGGLVAGTLGVQAAFVLDAASFLLSAVLIATINEPTGERNRAPEPAAHLQAAKHNSPHPLTELREGWAYVVSRRTLFWATFSKGFWSLGGGVLLLLTLFGREIFPIGRDGAISIGLLYAARGTGAALGPLLARHFWGESRDFLRRAIGPAIALSGLGYLLVSGSPLFVLALLGVVIAHMGGSIQWTFSSALLQLEVPDRLRGRVFAVEYAAMSMTTALSSYLAGLGSDAGLPTRLLATLLVLVFLLSGALVGVMLWHRE